MAIIREVRTRKASIDELRAYLLSGGYSPPYGPVLEPFKAPQFHPGQLIYVPAATDVPKEIGDRAVLITAVELDADEFLAYTVRYADEIGHVREFRGVREEVLGAMIRTSPTDYVAQAVVGDGMPVEISPLSWLKSMIDACGLPAVRDAVLAADADPDPVAYDEMVGEVAMMHRLLRGATGVDFRAVNI